MPFVIIVALAIFAIGGGDPSHPKDGSSSSGPLPAVSAAAPPQAQAQQAGCTELLQKLPVQLRTLKPRVVHTTPDTPYVVAWGDPAIVLACGADRPKDLRAGSSTQYYDASASGDLTGPYYDVTRQGDANVYTTVDRGPYVAITIPSHYQGADYLPELSKDVAAALPAVCTTNPATADVNKLCTRRTK